MSNETNTSSTSTLLRSRTSGRVAEMFSGHSSAAASVSEVNGKRMFRMSSGQMVELPSDMSAEEAARLDAEGSAAQKKLGKKPVPPAVPDIKEKAKEKVKDKKGDKKEKPKDKKGHEGKKLSGKKGGGEKAHAGKGFGKGKTALWLMAKGAPVIAKGKTKLQVLKTNEQTHDDSASKLGQIQKAVVPPVEEGQSNSNSTQVNTVDSKPVPQPSEANAKAALDKAIQENIPQSIEDVDNFKRDNKAGHMSAAAALAVNTDKLAVSGTFADMKQEPAPTPADVHPEALPPDEIAPATPAMNLGANAIAPLQPEHTDVSKFTKEADSKLKEEGVTQEQLDMVDSGDLADANKEKKGMEKKAKTEPAAVRQLAQHETKKVETDLQQEETRGKEEIKKERKNKLNATKEKQKGTKTAIEKKREEVANKINLIYKKAQEKVTKKLADLETISMKRFDDGNAEATKTFESNVKSQLDAFKDERYSGFWGWAKKAKDWLLGMEDLPEVKAIFDRNREAFVKTIGALTDSISLDNKKVIQECKEELAAARKEIKDYVDKLGPDVKDVGTKAQEEMNSRLDELDQTVNKKEEDLQNKLKDKQQAAIKAIDEKIEKMKEAMSGALSKLGALLLLAAKKFFTWALEKFGFSLSEIEGIINKGAAVLKAIFTQPIQFVKNLVNAAITGFKNFGANFLKHLKDALFEWLTGSLDGLTLPSVWNFQGIISVALQMIGISYQNIRKHMVTVMGEPVVVGLEKTFTLVKTLITEGPMAAWEQLKSMAAEMRDAFVDAVKDFIKVKIIEQAIQWVIGIFVPGAGIIKAIIGIYDTIVFFIQKAKQIMQMIGSFLGSVSEIAAGNIGAAADALENGLARGLSLVISFLAKLMHLDGITAKIKAAIQKIRDKVDAVMLKVAHWIADKAKQLWGAVKQGAANVGAKVAGWMGFSETFKGEDEKEHRLYIDGSAGASKIMVASTPEEVRRKVEKAESSMYASQSVSPEAKKEYAKEFNTLRSNLQEAENKIKANDGKENPDITKALKAIKSRAGILFSEFGGVHTGFDANEKKAPAIEIIDTEQYGSFKNKGAGKFEQAYVSNVPLYAKDVKSPATVANQYLKDGFDKEEDANKRFAQVIGVNMIEDPEGKNRTEVKKRINSAGWPSDHFPLGLIGFMWIPQWTHQGKEIKGDLKSYYNTLKPKEQGMMMKEHEQLSKVVAGNKGYAYGLFRDTIKNHSYTNDYITKMRQRAENVFVHSGDPDVVSLRASGNSEETLKRLFGLRANDISQGLFNRYDAVLKKAKAENRGKYPLVISGGYHFQFSTASTVEAAFATVLASVLDMRIREALVRINAAAVYYPEPNTLFNVTNDKSKGYILNSTYGVFKPEGQRQAKTMMELSGDDFNAAFDSSAVFETFADIRFVLTQAGDGLNLNVKTEHDMLIGYFRPDVNKIFEIVNKQEQSHSKPETWVNQVGTALGLEYKGVGNSSTWKKPLEAIYSTYINAVENNLHESYNTLKGTNPRTTETALAKAMAKNLLLLNLNKLDTTDKITALKDGIQKFFEKQLKDDPAALDLRTRQVLEKVDGQLPGLAIAAAEVIRNFIVSGLKR